MGESQTKVELEQESVIRPTFNGAIRVEARPERLSADAGALMMREVMERTGLIDWIDGRFNDPRRSDQITHSVSELMRTQLLLLAQGWSSADIGPGDNRKMTRNMIPILVNSLGQTVRQKSFPLQ